MVKRRQIRKEVMDYRSLEMEDKDFGAVALYGGGYVSPQCVVLYGTRCNREGNIWRDSSGTWNVVIYVTFLVGSIGDGFPVRDPEGYGKSLGKYDSGHSLYTA